MFDGINCTWCDEKCVRMSDSIYLHLSFCTSSLKGKKRLKEKKRVTLSFVHEKRSWMLLIEVVPFEEVLAQAKPTSSTSATFFFFGNSIVVVVEVWSLFSKLFVYSREFYQCGAFYTLASFTVSIVNLVSHHWLNC